EATQRLPTGSKQATDFHRIAGRRGTGIGRVAAARKLLTLVYYGLRDGQVGLKGAQTRSCSSLVLVQETTKQVASVHAALLILANNGGSGGWVWRLEPERPVRTVPVVVRDVDPKDLLEVASADDQEPVQALGANRPHPAFRRRVR